MYINIKCSNNISLIVENETKNILKPFKIVSSCGILREQDLIIMTNMKNILVLTMLDHKK